jgi:hypothetical protein
MTLISFGVFIPFLITGCATTKLTADWKDTSYQGQPRKIIVIGIAKKPATKRIFEDEFVRQLKARGTNAIASYTLIPDNKQDDHAIIDSKMKEQGADAVLISRLASKKTVLTHFHGSFYVQPSIYGTWRDYYAYGSQVMYTPGYTAEEELAIMETSLYESLNDKLIWSAVSETEILGSVQDQIKSFISVMVNSMTDQKLLK